MGWPWPAPVVVMGRSMGAPVAARLASVFPEVFDGLILDSGPANDKDELWRQALDAAGSNREEMRLKAGAVRTYVQESLPVGSVVGQDSVVPLGTCDLVRGY